MSRRSGSIKVWDVMVRLFHWLLVVSFLVAYLTQERNYEPHLFSGYLVLGLLAIRILWGLVGPRHARFADFLYRPSIIATYLKAMASRNPPRYIGHNPAGGLMVIALLVTLFVICVSGVALDAAENRAGPLADTRLFYYTDTIIDIHVISTNIGIALITLHLLGVLYASLVHRENLVRAMITGRKAVKPVQES